ncbi:S1C family serine protease [Micromonospora sp. DT81.3]|uniref:S1C family serine protease n=1 Tax=Micromonospora sp. DT81.3 TaxID=3416523 RepID=UPI003CEF70D1
MTENNGDIPAETPQARQGVESPSQPSAPAPAPAASGAPAAPTYRPAPPLPSAQPWTAPQQTAPTQPLGSSAGTGDDRAYAGPPTGQSFGVTAPQQSYAWAPSAPAGAATDTKKNKGAGKVVGLIVAAALVGGAAGLGGAAAGNSLFPGQTQSPAAAPSAVTVNNPDDVNATTAIATKTLPSVVTIEVSSGSAGGSGSGVILTSDGYVVTNTHVVTLDGATADPAIRVTTSDGHLYDAEVVGLDPVYDLAVIKLADAEGLTPIEFADSSDLNVGSSTVAVGAPLGLANTVTTGIVSALNRSIEIASAAVPDTGDESDQSEEAPAPGEGGPFTFDIPGQQQSQTPSETISISVIQTDAAINPGNSGGALVDGEGRLIGINVAIASAGSSSGQSGSIGVGFSIPSNVVQRVTDEIIENGVATHGLLGANVSAASSIEGSTIAGAYIAAVSEGGAAASAGLREGDVVTEFNGVPITDQVDLTAQVRAAAAGSDASLTYVRDGESVTVDVTLGTLGE